MRNSNAPSEPGGDQLRDRVQAHLRELAHDGQRQRHRADVASRLELGGPSRPHLQRWPSRADKTSRSGRRRRRRGLAAARLLGAEKRAPRCSEWVEKSISERPGRIPQRGPVGSQAGRTCLFHTPPRQRDSSRANAAVCRSFALVHAGRNGAGERDKALAGPPVFPLDVRRARYLALRVGGARPPTQNSEEPKNGAFRPHSPQTAENPRALLMSQPAATPLQRRRPALPNPLRPRSVDKGAAGSLTGGVTVMGSVAGVTGAGWRPVGSASSSPGR